MVTSYKLTSLCLSLEKVPELLKQVRDFFCLGPTYYKNEASNREMPAFIQALRYRSIRFQKFTLESYSVAAHHANTRTVVLCHGAGGSWIDLLEPALLYHQANYNVVLWSYPGCGTSLPSTSQLLHWKPHFSSLVDTMLKSQHFSTKELAFCGISLGGARVFEYQGEHKRTSKQKTCDILFFPMANVLPDLKSQPTTLVLWKDSLNHPKSSQCCKKLTPPSAKTTVSNCFKLHAITTYVSTKSELFFENKALNPHPVLSRKTISLTPLAYQLIHERLK